VGRTDRTTDVEDTQPLSYKEILERHARPQLSEPSDSYLYVYAIVRKDLEMPSGKLSAQAGHAYTDALEAAQLTHPDRCKRYRSGIEGGSKVTLEAKNANHLVRAYNEARALGLPCQIVVDQNHVMLPHFDGNPVITALGIGPVCKSEVKHITKKFRCVK
jgi:PTH2 family peptidyl-tRNA hydrolase